MTGAHQVGGQIEVFPELGFVAYLIVNGLQLKANSGKTLGQSVVDLVGQSLPFFEHGTELHALDAPMDGLSGKHQQQKQNERQPGLVDQVAAGTYVSICGPAKYPVEPTEEAC